MPCVDEREHQLLLAWHRHREVDHAASCGTSSVARVSVRPVAAPTCAGHRDRRRSRAQVEQVGEPQPVPPGLARDPARAPRRVGQHQGDLGVVRPLLACVRETRRRRPPGPRGVGRLARRASVEQRRPPRRRSASRRRRRWLACLPSMNIGSQSASAVSPSGSGAWIHWHDQVHRAAPEQFGDGGLQCSPPGHRGHACDHHLVEPRRRRHRSLVEVLPRDPEDDVPGVAQVAALLGVVGEPVDGGVAWNVQPSQKIATSGTSVSLHAQHEVGLGCRATNCLRVQGPVRPPPSLMTSGSRADPAAPARSRRAGAAVRAAPDGTSARCASRGRSGVLVLGEHPARLGSGSSSECRRRP